MKKYNKTQRDWEIGLASMSGRSDYCKHLFAGLSRSSLGQTPYKYAKILWSLHCLPVQYRCFSFKILFCVHRAFHGFALLYISDLLTVYNPVRPLRSSGRDPLLLESVCAEGAFSYCGSVLWNKLPVDLRSITFVPTFKNKLKTSLFTQAYTQ